MQGQYCDSPGGQLPLQREEPQTEALCVAGHLQCPAAGYNVYVGVSAASLPLWFIHLFVHSFLPSYLSQLWPLKQNTTGWWLKPLTFLFLQF